MKRFLIKVLFAAGFALLVAVSVIALRIALAQKNVRAAFDVPPGTEVVFIGNSHTGCTFYEAPEFRNRVVWQSAMGFLFHYLRFLEMERLGLLDGGVKTCVVDCDSPSLDCFLKSAIVQNAIAIFPIVWRYLDKIPVSNGEILFEAFLRSGCDYSFREEVPQEVSNWTTRARERREVYLKVLWYSNGVPPDWDSEAFPRDWQTRFYEMVADMKARCDKRGIRLVFFASPLASDYPDRNDPLVYRRISDVAARVRSMGVEYYDYRTTCPDNKFRDAGHLLRSASYEFTKKFYAEVLKLPVGE